MSSFHNSGNSRNAPTGGVTEVSDIPKWFKNRSKCLFESKLHSPRAKDKVKALCIYKMYVVYINVLQMRNQKIPTEGTHHTKLLKNRKMFEFFNFMLIWNPRVPWVARVTPMCDCIYSRTWYNRVVSFFEPSTSSKIYCKMFNL